MGCVTDGQVGDLQTIARLTDMAFFASEPHDAYTRLRREAPVFWYEEGEIWGISKCEDAKFVLSRPELFSSEYGLIFTQSKPYDHGSACPLSEMPRRAELRRQAFLQLAGTESIVGSDPPRHTRLRRLVSSAFSPRLVSQLEATIRDLAREAIERIEPDMTTDIVDVLTRPIPLLVIARMLGVPRDEWQRFARWSDAATDATAAVQNPTEEPSTAWMEQLIEFGQYFSGQLALRRQDPRDDVLTAIQNEIDGETLSEWDQILFALVLLSAGNETTQVLLAGGIKLLAEHPDQRAILAGDPGAIPQGIEEILRYVTPVPTFCRTARDTVHLRGRQIEKGDYVVVIHAAANRDEDVWDEADRFIVSRKPDSGIAFGFGPHFCLGAALARLETRIVFEELLRRYPHFEMAGSAHRAPTGPIPRYESMPVVFRRQGES